MVGCSMNIRLPHRDGTMVNGALPALSALDRTKGRGNEAAEGLKDLVSALH